MKMRRIIAWIIAIGMVLTVLPSSLVIAEELGAREAVAEVVTEAPDGESAENPQIQPTQEPSTGIQEKPLDKKLAQPYIEKIQRIGKNKVRIYLHTVRKYVEKYRVEISTKKDFSNGVKIKVKSNGTKRFKVKSNFIKKGRKLYFRVKSMGSRPDSNYSMVREYKVKKYCYIKSYRYEDILGQ